MARQQIVVYKDDLDGSEEGVRPVKFSYGGRDYEIDLSGENDEKLRKALEPFINAATIVRTTRSAPAQRSPQPYGTRTARAMQDRQERARIREWAAANGYKVKPRGRIPDRTVVAYHKATRGS